MVPGDYDRNESRAHQLDRNWSELVQELRVMGTGVQILFAFLLSIAFQARFQQTSATERDIYLVTLVLSALATALLIAPVSVHRFLFRIRLKDELVQLTNAVAIAGLAVLSLSMVGAVVLICDWVGGTAAAVICGAGAAVVLGGGWFVLPFMLRHRARDAERAAVHERAGDSR
jgi:cytochrome bd-type quinol oxidase subunit 2